MKVFFDHIAGNSSNRELVYSPATAVFDESEYEFAVQNGWHIAESWGVEDFGWFNDVRKSGSQVWYQARSTRIEVSKFLERSRHRKKIRKAKISCSVEVDVSSISQELWGIYNSYLQYKGFSNFYEKSDDLFTELYGDRKYLVYRDENKKLIAFSVVEIVSQSVAVAPQFAWDYSNPALGLGSLNKFFQFRLLNDLSVSHLYMGNSYELASLGKMKWPGFQWWTGRGWSDDKELFSFLLEQESKMKTLDDLYAVQSAYYSKVR